jgi:cob(I)alamin adenosyltransferase
VKIYTKTGDKGETSLIGKRTPKDSITIELIGKFDHLNSLNGLINSHISKEIPYLLTEIQNIIFKTSSQFALQKEDELSFLEPFVLKIEHTIDQMSQDLPELKNFILPGGSIVSSHIHVTRTYTRNLERYCVSNFKDNFDLLKFVNRLSDYYFTLARFCNVKLGVDDIIWKDD